MKTMILLRTIQIISWIMMLGGFLFPLIAHLEGKRLESWPIFILMAGVVGVFSHQVMRYLDQRISRMEGAQADKSQQTPGDQKQP